MKRCVGRFGVVLALAAILCTGCGNDSGTVNDKKPNVTGTITPETTPEATPTEIPKNTNPLEFEGLEEYEGDNLLDEAEHVKLLTKLSDSTKMAEGYVIDLGIVSYEKDYVLVKFFVAQSQEDYLMGENCKTYFYLLDAKTFEVVKEVALDCTYTILQPG